MPPATISGLGISSLLNEALPLQVQKTHLSIFLLGINGG